MTLLIRNIGNFRYTKNAISFNFLKNVIASVCIYDISCFCKRMLIAK